MNAIPRTTLATAIAGSLFSAPALAVNLAQDGIGEVAIAPYYTVRDGWSTLINLTNTQNVPIVVKVRVHEALNSRDVLDFNIAMSAFDVFTGIIQENEAGEPIFRSTDSPNEDGRYTCTIPAAVAVNPDGTRNETGIELQTGGYVNDSDSSDNDGGPTTADRLREGYIEFIVMGYADGSKDGPLKGGFYNDAKNTPIPAGVINVGNATEQHDCELLDLAFTDQDSPRNEPYILETARQYGEPINALKFNFRLLNPARGIEAGNAATTWANFFNPHASSRPLPPPGEPGEEIILDPSLWISNSVRPVDNQSCSITRGDERRSSVDASPPSADRSVDWLPGDTTFSSCQNLITAQVPFAFLEPSLNDAYPPYPHWYEDTFDVHVTALPVRPSNDPAPPLWGPFRGIEAMSVTIQRQTIINEWSNNAALGVTTDWIVTQPTKAFYVDEGFDLDTTDGQQSAITEDRLEAQLLNESLPYEPYQEYWDKSGEPDGACNDVSFIYYDRAEQTPTTPPGGVIISPAPPIPVETEKLCYETTVITFNDQSAFDEPASNRIDIDTSGLPEATNGWMFMKLDDFAGARMPVSLVAVAFGGSEGGVVTDANVMRGLPVIGFNLKVRNFGSADANYASSLDHSYTRTYAISPDLFGR